MTQIIRNTTLANGSGTTASGNSINIGGTLTGASEVLGSFPIRFGTNASPLTGFEADVDGGSIAIKSRFTAFFPGTDFSFSLFGGQANLISTNGGNTTGFNISPAGGGRITVRDDISSALNAGMFYQDVNYSSNQPTWIPHQQWVLDEIGAAVVNDAENGITFDNVFDIYRLGGELTQATTIESEDNGQANFNLGTIGSKRLGIFDSYFNELFFSTDNTSAGPSNSLRLQPASMQLLMREGNPSNPSGGTYGLRFAINAGNSEMEFVDGTSARGIRYFQNYATNGIAAYGNRWITDKEYDDGHLGGNDLSSTLISPGASQDGQGPVWNQTAQEWQPGDGGGPTSFTFEFGKGGSINTGDVIPAGVSGTAATALPIPIPVDIDIIDIAVNIGLTTVSVAGNIPVLVREVTSSSAGIGSALTSSSGTLKRTINCALTTGTRYHRTFLDTNIAAGTVEITAGNLLLLAIGTITSTGTYQDIKITIRGQRR